MPALEGFWLRDCQGAQGWAEALGVGTLSPHLGYLPEVWPVMSRESHPGAFTGLLLRSQWPGSQSET